MLSSLALKEKALSIPLALQESVSALKSLASSAALLTACALIRSREVLFSFIFVPFNEKRAEA
jgi:hypothetical protein